MSRSRRGHRDAHAHRELNIVPMMNLVIILIPALLLASSFVQLSVINVTAPIISPGPPDGEPPAVPELELSVIVTDLGFRLLTKRGDTLCCGEASEEIPLRAKGAYDFAALTERLAALKEDNPDARKLTLTAEPEIDYATLVATMDATRHDGRRELFPDVMMSAGVR